MPLKAELDSLDGVPEVLHEHYTKDDKSGKYVLSVEGLVPKAKLDEFRQNNINLSRDRDRVLAELEELKKGYGNLTPEQVAEMSKTLEGIKDKKVLDDEGIEALVEKRLTGIRTEHEAQLKARDKKISELQQQSDEWSSKFRKTVIDRAITDAAIKAGVRPSALMDVTLRAQGMWTLNDQGKLVAKGSDGEVIYGKDGATPLTPAEWMEVLKTEAVHIFEPSGGGGASGNNGTGGPANIRIKYKTDLKTAAEKSKFISEHGIEAFERLPLRASA